MPLCTKTRRATNRIPSGLHYFFAPTVALVFNTGTVINGVAVGTATYYGSHFLS
jgi:hypothetical protein